MTDEEKKVSEIKTVSPMTSVDFAKLREDEKQSKKYELTEQQKLVLKEQEKLGSKMDTLMKKEHFLRKHAEEFKNDESLFLYRLPLSKKQLEEVHSNLMKEYNNK